MLDPLLCCYVIALIKLAGCFINVENLLRWAMAQVGAMRAMARPNGKRAAPPAPGTWSQAVVRAPAIFRTEEELAESVAQYFAENLARLESYVASMA